MSSEEQKDFEKRRRAQEAASILRRLDENPNDVDALSDREDFLARGENERRTFKTVERVFLGAKKGLRRKDRRTMIGIAFAMLASLYFAWEPAKVMLFADHQSGYAVESIRLASGDSVVLDASSAISDDSDDKVRKVTLLKGGGYFSIDKEERTFIVQSGEVSIEVIGTEFEVSQLNDTLIVSVAEGQVEVRRSSGNWMLMPSERLRITNDQVEQLNVESDNIASWRAQELSMDGMTLSDVTSVIDRRFQGKIVVLGDELQSLQVTGRLNLTNSSNALETIAAAVGADVYRITPYLVILSPR